MMYQDPNQSQQSSYDQPQSVGSYPPQQPYVPAQYPQPAYPPQNQYPVFVAAPTEPGSGMAVASLVLGILSIVLCWVWFLVLPLSIVGIIMGALGRRTISRRGIATAGLVCSIVGLAAFLILLIIGLAIIHSYSTYP